MSNSKHVYEQGGQLQVSEMHPLYSEIERPARPLEKLSYKVKRLSNMANDFIRQLLSANGVTIEPAHLSPERPMTDVVRPSGRLETQRSMISNLEFWRSASPVDAMPESIPVKDENIGRFVRFETRDDEGWNIIFDPAEPPKE